MTIKIEISVDKQKCVQCGKIKIGCYKQESGRYICPTCILSNIKNRSKETEE